MVIYRLRLCVLVLCASLQAFCKQAATLQGLDNPTRQLQQDASKNPAEELTLAQISGKWVGLTFPLVEVGGLACLSEACRESIPTKVVFEISGDRLVYDGLLGDAVAANEQTCLTAGANERFEGRIKDFSESRLYVDFSFQEVDLKTSDANGDPILAAFDLSVADVELSCVKMKVGMDHWGR
ncbi:hypothetical protein BSKO_10709 [Bryopsis sp. KO-2023]|nr:hypothetical protein BSKO_10709 [Bryopsis sp. KO-2023]